MTKTSQLPPWLVRPMRAILVMSVAFAMTQAGRVFAGAPDTAFLLGFLAGDYRVVGQDPNSGAAYAGRISLREHDGKLEATRTVGGVSMHGTATLDTTAERTTVLRLRFALAGVEYEGTYLWRSDLDNYPRLTGYVYRSHGPTDSPGLFHVPPTPEK